MATETSSLSFESNSHASRSNPDKRIKPVAKATRVEPPKSGFNKFLTTFVSSKPKDVWNYVWTDILIPAIKKTVTDTITEGVYMFIYKDPKPTAPRTSAGTYSYRSCYDNRAPFRESGRNESRTTETNYKDIVFATRDDAEKVIENLIDIIDQYGQATVADLCDLADISCEWTANNFGWTNLATASVIRDRAGYILNLPTARSLKR